MIWFTADQHFGHHNIIKYCKRPFQNVNEMNKVIIERYNQVVSDNDTVYFLGDVALHDKDEYIKIRRCIRQLKGEKHLILGNHDKLKPFTYLKIGFESVHTQLELNTLLLVHDPANAYKRPNKLHITGHVHNLWVVQNNCYNVGLELHNYYPVDYKYIQGYLEEGNFQ